MPQESQNNHKYRAWMMTIFVPDGNKLLTTSIFELIISEYATKYAFQMEVTPTTNKDHFQVAFETKDRKRQSTIINYFSKELSIPKENITVDKMHGTWLEAVTYVTKEETRKVGDSPKVSGNVLAPYTGQDLEVLKSRDTRFPWQNKIMDLICKDNPLNVQPATDREVYWITDIHGCSGKSLFVKYLCYYNSAIKKISFGTSNQLRSGIIDAGPAKVYVVDLPRTLGKEDSLNNVITVIEDLKSGFVVSNFHGKSRQLMCMPPHVIVFANMECPIDKLSHDRWVLYEILPNREIVSACL